MGSRETIPALRKWYRDTQRSEGRHTSVTPWYHQKKNAVDRKALTKALWDRGWTYSAIALVTEYRENTVSHPDWLPSCGEEPSGRVLEALTELLSARGWFAYEGREYRPIGVGVSIEGAVKDAVLRGSDRPKGCRPIANKEEFASVVAKLNTDVDPLRSLDDAILALESWPTDILLAARDCLAVTLKNAANSIRAAIEASGAHEEPFEARVKGGGLEEVEHSNKTRVVSARGDDE